MVLTDVELAGMVVLDIGISIAETVEGCSASFNAFANLTHI
jgi:hypothetical protein